MTNYTTLSDSELTEALNFHRRQRNMSRGINEAAHARQTQMVRMLEAEEARRLNEEKPNKYVIYKHKDKYGVSQDIGTGYNWDHSYHHGYHDTVDAAKAWAAKHAGKYPHNVTVKEEVEQIDEISKSTLGSYATKAMNRADIAARMSRSDSDEMGKIANKRTTGVKKAVDRLAGKKTAASIKSNIDKAREAARNRGTDRDDEGKAYYAAQKGISKIREEVEQIDEISTELKKRYVEKGAEDVVDRFTGRGKYERPRDPSKYTKTGRPKKSALNSPEAVKYRAKLDNRSDIVNKVSQEVHGKKRFGEEVVLDEGYNDPEYIRRAIPALRNAVDFHKELSHEHDKKSTSGSPEYVRAHSAAAKAHREAAERHKIAHAQLSHGSKDVEYYVKPARELGAYAEKLSAKANALKEEAEINEASLLGPQGAIHKQASTDQSDREYIKQMAFKNAWKAKNPGKPWPGYEKAGFKEEVEINEASDLRITKIYNKWPKKATYAVHTPDRKYFKEFDSMEAAKAHHAEKTSK